MDRMSSMMVIESHTEDQVASDSVQVPIEQAAALAGVHEKTIRRAIDAGILNPIMDARYRYLFDRDEVLRAVQECGGPPLRLQGHPRAQKQNVLARPVVSGPPSAEEFIQLLSRALADTHSRRIEEQAEIIGAQRERISLLEAQLAAATSPKERRPAAHGVRRPRASVPLDDPLMAAAVLVRRFDRAGLRMLLQTLTDVQGQSA